MFTNILVPLDGSKLAETAFNPAESLARSMNAGITLLHIIEKDAPKSIHSDHHLSQVIEAEAYLKNIAESNIDKQINIQTHVHTAEVKDVAKSIIQHASEEYSPDLIVMCAHGQGGFRDFVFGNIAQQVIAGGQTPVLMLQPQNAKPETYTIKKIIVPLDGESKHDLSLEYAKNIAKAFDSEIYLLTVIPTLGTLTGPEAAISSMLPTTSSVFFDILEEEAKGHLQQHLNDFLGEGYKTDAEIGRGDPADVILSTASRVNADLILMSTHRKTGMEAFWARSVAPGVIKRTQIPLLLIPLPL